MYRVFCFDEIKNCEAGSNYFHLLGVKNGNTICVTDAISRSSVKDLSAELVNYYSFNSNITVTDHPTTTNKLEIVGKLFSQRQKQQETSDLNKTDQSITHDRKCVPPFVILRLNKNEINLELLDNSDVIVTDRVLLFYERRQFTSSSLVDTVMHQGSTTSIIHNALATTKHVLKEINNNIKDKSLISNKSWDDGDDDVGKYAELGFFTKLLFIMMLQIVTSVDSYLPSIRLPRIQVFSLPSIVKHVQCKYDDMSNFVTSVARQPSRFNQLRFKNYLTLTLIDTFVGVVILTYLLQPDQLDQLAHFLLSAAEWIGSELERLIFWLQGNPAGLKLNKPLANFLSHFFLYHVFLWKAYLTFLIPILSTILKFCVLCGIFGFSMQCCVMRDVLSLMTLHVYCFYVYAAKLYSLQLIAVKSLWRLFRGKKFNALKLRVDSLDHNVDAMFVGTLAFTILLFMMPTTLVFYVVFLVLRLATLALHAVMYCFIFLINHVHLYWLYVRCARAHKLNCLNELQIHVNKELSFKLKLRPLGLLELIKLSSSSPTSSSSQSASSSIASLKNCIRKFFTGDLIFPWIDKQDKLNNKD